MHNVQALLACPRFLKLLWISITFLSSAGSPPPPRVFPWFSAHSVAHFRGGFNDLGSQQCGDELRKGKSCSTSPLASLGSPALGEKSAPLRQLNAAASLQTRWPRTKVYHLLMNSAASSACCCCGQVISFQQLEWSKTTLPLLPSGCDLVCRSPSLRGVREASAWRLANWQLESQTQSLGSGLKMKAVLRVNIYICQQFHIFMYLAYLLLSFLK